MLTPYWSCLPPFNKYLRTCHAQAPREVLVGGGLLKGRSIWQEHGAQHPRLLKMLGASMGMGNPCPCADPTLSVTYQGALCNSMWTPSTAAMSVPTDQV